MEKEHPKVSVIMGVYNGADRMDEAISSIIVQTFKDWEFIICDDASTDDTWKKLVEWSKKEPRIIPLHNETNMKLAATLNKCLERATGDYVARMDDDDYSYPWRLRAEHDFLEINTKYAFVSGQVNGLVGKKIIEDYWHRKEFPKKWDFLISSQFIHPATMFRRIPLKKAGGYRVAPETRRLEDYDLFMRLYAMGYIGCNLKRPLLRYTIDNTKTTYAHRIDEVLVRFRGFMSMKLMPWGFPFIFRPLLVGLVPRNILWKIKTVDKKRKRREKIKKKKKMKKYGGWRRYFKF